jgi:hypothetical protein
VSPRDRLAPGRGDRAYATRHRIVRVGCEKVLVAFERVSIECGKVGFVRFEIPDRPLPQRCRLLRGHRRRRRIRGAFEEVDWSFQLGGMPRHLPAIGDLIDAQTDPRKSVIEGQAAFAGNFRKGLRVGRVRAAFVGRDGAGCRVERNQRAGFGLDQRQPAGQRIS